MSSSRPRPPELEKHVMQKFLRVEVAHSIAEGLSHVCIALISGKPRYPPRPTTSAHPFRNMGTDSDCRRCLKSPSSAAKRIEKGSSFFLKLRMIFFSSRSEQKHCQIFREGTQSVDPAKPNPEHVVSAPLPLSLRMNNNHMNLSLSLSPASPWHYTHYLDDDWLTESPTPALSHAIVFAARTRLSTHFAPGANPALTSFATFSLPPSIPDPT